MNETFKNQPEPHIIRLRGPCELAWTRNGTQHAAVRVQIPCEIGPELFDEGETLAADEYILRRSFRMPTGLEPSQRVTLELNDFEGLQRLDINRGTDVDLEIVATGKERLTVDLSDRLLPANRLEFTFPAATSKAGNVRLVIEQ